MSEFEDLDSIEVAQQVIKSLRSQRSTQRSLLEEPGDNSLRAKDLNRIIAKEKLVRNKYVEEKDNVDKLLMTSLIEPVANLSIQRSPQDDFSESSDDELSTSYNSSQKSTSKSKVIGIRSKIIDCRKSDSELFQKKNIDNGYDSDIDLHDNSDDEKELQELLQDFVPPTSKMNVLSKSTTSMNTTKRNNNIDVVNSSLQKGIVIKPGQAIKVKSIGGKTKKY